MEELVKFQKGSIYGTNAALISKLIPRPLLLRFRIFISSGIEAKRVFNNLDADYLFSLSFDTLNM